MTQKLYVFWRYDLFPYVLGGEVLKVEDDKCFRVKGYGKLRLINHIAVEGDKGAILLESLEKLREFNRNLTHELEYVMCLLVFNACGEVGVDSGQLENVLGLQPVGEIDSDLWDAVENYVSAKVEE